MRKLIYQNTSKSVGFRCWKKTYTGRHRCRSRTGTQTNRVLTRTLNTELNKKDLHDPDNHDGVITHLEPDVLECEVKVGLMKHHYEQRLWG